MVGAHEAGTFSSEIDAHGGTLAQTGANATDVASRRGVDMVAPVLISTSPTAECAVAVVVVDVMLKPEILDPQGQAILGALGRLGQVGITSVRQGKHFELEVDGAADDAALDRIRELARTLLSNPVIEDFDVRVA